jgi:hypothetical protein
MIDKIKKKFERSFIGPIEKGMEAAKLKTAPKSIYQGVDLRFLPKYISYKAALLKEKSTLQFVLITVILLHTVYYMTSRFEISKLHKNLREKEYILAPGVLDFNTASPQSVSSEYIENAVESFVQKLGNINPTNITKQYGQIQEYMDDRVKIKFQMEYENWIDQVMAEQISQIFTIKDKEIISNNNGDYRAKVFGRAEFYSNTSFLGHEDQVVEMSLKLIPPQTGKRWYLQIQSLNWSQLESFNIKSKFQK